MLSGPYGAMILADLGAETIKVEPLAGEGTRKLLATDPKNSLDGMGAYYITLNRNKQSVSIDLKSEQGLGVFHDLVKESDIVISNFWCGCSRAARYRLRRFEQGESAHYYLHRHRFWLRWPQLQTACL